MPPKKLPKGIEAKGKHEKLRMMKTKQTRKATRKFNILASRGKLKRHVIEKVNQVKASKSEDSRKRMHDIEEDWEVDRQVQYAEEADEDILPLDMLDADIDWENSGFAGLKRRHDKRTATEQIDSENNEEDCETKKRRFEKDVKDDEEEMLPIKLNDGTLLRPYRKKEIVEETKEGEEEEGEEKTEVKEEEKKLDESDDEDEDGKTKEKKKVKEEDYSHLPATEIMQKRKELLDEAKQAIATSSHQLLANPQENIYKLRDLFRMCEGVGVHSLIREKVQQLATASMIKIWIDIIPGYAIRTMTEVEKDVRFKKETMKLITFEEGLLRYYLKYLEFAEKQSSRLCRKQRKWNENSFSHKLAILGMKALCRLLLGVPHFNYATNIVTALMKLTLSSHAETVTEVTNTFRRMFSDDLSLKISLFTVKAIVNLVKNKMAVVPPVLLETLLSLKIKEVANMDKKSGVDRLIAKKYQIKKERKSKSSRKYDKQLKKLEHDLREVEAAEEIGSKLKTATQTMKNVFQIYFSIIRRMPKAAILEPVLEGLSKFAHLLNIDFFEDIIKSMEDLVDRQHLRLIDQLHCVNTVFVILSGEGSALNVDPFRFYRSVYGMLNGLPFEKSLETRRKEMFMLAKTMDLMINARRKQIPLMRVAAYVRRLVTLAILLDDHSAILLLSTCRTFFIAHPKLASLVDEDDSEVGGMFRADLDDPDICRALGSDLRPLLRVLIQRDHYAVRSIADNILHAVPSTGPRRLNPDLTARKPWALLEDTFPPESPNSLGLLGAVNGYARKLKQKVTAQNVFMMTEQYVESLSKKKN